MTLRPDWKAILTKAWSVKLLIVAGLLSGIEAVMQIVEPTLAGSLPPGAFAALSGLVTAGALVARVLSQNEVLPDDAAQ